MKDIIEYKLVRTIRDLARVLGYQRHFTIGSLSFDVDIASVGKTPLGYPAAIDIIKFIEEKNLTNLKILDIACGVGIIGLTVFKHFIETDRISECTFSDINFFNLNSLEKALKLNSLEKYKGIRIKIILSDVLDQIPGNEKFDIIFSNPPDFEIKDFTDVELTGKTLGRYSEGHSFHKKFYSQCLKHLHSNGQIWFIENQNAISKSKNEEIIRSNSKLQDIRFINSPTLKDKREDIYWSISTMNL